MTPVQLKIQSLEAQIAWLKDNDTKIEWKYRSAAPSRWSTTHDPRWNHAVYYYRIAQPKKEKKLKRVPLEMIDFDGEPIILVDYLMDNSYLIVTKIDSTGLFFESYRSFKELFDRGWKYSFDRKNWKHFYKEVEVEA